ncbi:hypothetical protein DFR67_103164 [Williamsia limnetica]|uniref:Uncharacterized protein n=1 Tax=Williamsia limnetica TaxID=882452 RepID=A0A318RLR2_WILLI|nr:hypothetical protein [Williamsia limnetica]PYE19253.1 hypothetical protein DFR67_103164 [Williamsia limnetica]
MTDTTTTDPAAQIDADDATTLDPNTGTPGIETDDQDDDTDPIESRKYRKRAQVAESERDALAVKLAAVQRAEITRLATDLADPTDLFEYGNLDLAEVTDVETGHVDPEAVARAQAELLEQRPGLARAELKKPVPGTYANAGQFQRGATPGGKRSPSFASTVFGISE